MTRPLQFRLDVPGDFDTVSAIFTRDERPPDRAALVCRADFHTLDVARRVAAAASRLGATGHERNVIDTYLATDEGESHSPRYDVVRAPRLGDLVSSSFNGDSYPEGEVVRVSDSFRRVETSTGKVYYRRRQSGSWIAGGTWFLTEGHVRETNWEK